MQDINCQDDEGKFSACREKNRVGTKASVACKPGYELPDHLNVTKEFSCLLDGYWDHKLFYCIPICGKPTPLAQTFILQGSYTGVTEVKYFLQLFRLC